MVKYLRKIWELFNRDGLSLFEVSVEKQRVFLETLPVPKDDMERSYNQYCCQMFFRCTLMKIFLNIVSLPLMFVYYLRSYGKIIPSGQYDAVAVLDGKPLNIIPDELKDKFDSWYSMLSYNNNVYLGNEEKHYFRKLVKRYPFSWFFLFKCLIKICNYAFLIHHYAPKTIVVCSEYSFTSSVLTDYCESKGIEHIDVMHGEKLYNIRDSFFRYHRCYVWDEHYITLFGKLKACEEQFILAMPCAVLFRQSSAKQIFDYTYYLGEETESDIERIVSYLNILAHAGYKVAIRPHPRYTNVNDIEVDKDLITVEIGIETSIEESILRTSHVISLYSTVLNQACHNGVEIVIDDLSRPDMFRKLSELDYVVLQYEHKLLSEVLCHCKIS